MTFSEHVSLHIIPFIESQINQSTERIDAVCDNYPEINNLKALVQQGVVMVWEQELAMAVPQSQNMNGTVPS